VTRNTIEEELKKGLGRLGVPDAPFAVSVPEKGFGDYSTNAPLVAAKELSLTPREVAQALLENIADGLPFVEKIEIAGPGFLNFYLSRSYLCDSLKSILSEGWKEGAVLAGKEILIEYTSPNLFKPLHIGNLVGNILGESLSRLLEYEGAHVRRINYPSDIGLTVAKGVWGLISTGGDPRDIKALGKAYQVGNTAYEDDVTAKGEIDDINKALYEGSNATLNVLREEGIRTSRAHLSALCAVLGTQFDTEFFESESGPLGRDIVLAHINDVFEKSDGAIVYRGEQDGLHTRVFLNSQGLPTYEAKDIGLFDLKSRAYPQFDTSLTVTGAEQTDYFKVVFAAIRRVFHDRLKNKNLHHIANGFLRLSTGKMSSRKGNVITGESLIEDIKAMVKEKMKNHPISDMEKVATSVAIAGIKYSILRQAAGGDIVFDPEKSLSFEGDSGPYLQYSYVRACSIKKKAQVENLVPEVSADMPISSVEKLLIYFPEVVERAALEYQPHLLTTYLTTLAGAFNSWYAKERIVEDSEAGRHKLAVTEAFRITMERGLWLLGIAAPQEM